MQITEVESWLLCRFIAAVFCCQEYTEYTLKQTNKKTCVIKPQSKTNKMAVLACGKILLNIYHHIR